MDRRQIERCGRALWRRGARATAYLVMPKYTTGSVVVARRADEVLLVRKRTAAGEWGFPGGYLWYGQEHAAAAAREFAQETGLHVVITPGHQLAAYRQPWCAHLDHVFLLAADGRPVPRDTREIADARWWPIGELPALAPETRLALERIPDLLTRPIP